MNELGNPSFYFLKLNNANLSPGVFGLKTGVVKVLGKSNMSESVCQ